MSISYPQPQSPEEAEANRLRTAAEVEAEVAKIETVHATTQHLRREFESSNVGAVHRASRLALKEMTSSAA